jgi:hypothetical protein
VVLSGLIVAIPDLLCSALELGPRSGKDNGENGPRASKARRCRGIPRCDCLLIALVRLLICSHIHHYLYNNLHCHSNQTISHVLKSGACRVINNCKPLLHNCSPFQILSMSNLSCGTVKESGIRYTSTLRLNCFAHLFRAILAVAIIALAISLLR